MAPKPQRRHRKRVVRMWFAVYVVANNEANCQVLAARLQKGMRKICPTNKVTFDPPTLGE